MKGFKLHSGYLSPLIGRLLLGAFVILVPLLAAACIEVDQSEPAHSADDLSLVWEAWSVLQENYVAPQDFEEAKVAGGAIERLVALGEMDPYPFLTDLGRMRGQVPGVVPPALVDCGGQRRSTGRTIRKSTPMSSPKSSCGA